MLSAAITVMVFNPSDRFMSAVKVLLVTAAFTPFTVTMAILSSTVPVTVMGLVLTLPPLTGEIMVMTGAVVRGSQ